MFLCQPLLDVLMGRGVEDVDSFIQLPSWNDLPDPLSMTGMTNAVDRVLAAIRDKQRIAVFGDYDCDGVLGAHILRMVFSGFGMQPRVYLPHRDEGYGLNAPAVHQFSMAGTDLLITVDNGINARKEAHLAQRLGADVIVIDHHRIQDQANVLSVWSSEFCGAGLAALFAWALALRAGWTDKRVERLLSAVSLFAAIASVADCVPLIKGTRTLTRLGMRGLTQNEHSGLRELLRASCVDPSRPDSNDLAFGVAPRINAAGRMAHPSLALAVFDAHRNEEGARKDVEVLNQLNRERRQLVKAQFEELCAEIEEPVPAGLVMYRASCPRGVVGLVASKCVERFSMPSIVLAPSPTPGLVVGSGRSVKGFDLIEGLERFRHLLTRFGGHSQAAGLTMLLAHVETFAREFAVYAASFDLQRDRTIHADIELVLATAGKQFDEQLAQLEPFGEGNPAPVFLLHQVEIENMKDRWVRIRQGRYSLEALCWDLSLKVRMRGDCMIEFRGKRRILKHFRDAAASA